LSPIQLKGTACCRNALSRFATCIGSIRETLGQQFVVCFSSETPQKIIHDDSTASQEHAITSAGNTATVYAANTVRGFKKTEGFSCAHIKAHGEPGLNEEHTY